MGLETAVMRFLLRPYLLGFLCLLSVGALLWIGARLLSFFSLAVDVTADAWVPALIGALCCVHATRALHRPAATPDQIFKPLGLCVRLLSWCLLHWSFHPFGPADTFDQLLSQDLCCDTLWLPSLLPHDMLATGYVCPGADKMWSRPLPSSRVCCAHYRARYLFLTLLQRLAR